MARIFISHNSQDAKEAAAVKRWLTDNGWDDTFLDIDAKDGLSPGERWKDALKTRRTAAKRLRKKSRSGGFETQSGLPRSRKRPPKHRRAVLMQRRALPETARLDW
jgi:hypothetical protein